LTSISARPFFGRALEKWHVAAGGAADEDHRGRGPGSAPARDPGRADSSQDALVVKVSTDAGITGWGEVDGCPYVTKAIIEAPMTHTLVTGLRQLLIGATDSAACALVTSVFMAVHSRP
jgi:L-alanine-DL-glutamate epimerase-like enolase superfamily enzyme